MKRFYPILVMLAATLLLAAAPAQTLNQTSKSPTTDGAAGAATAEKNDTSEPPDPLLDVPPMPKGKVSLIGGTVTRIDQIRNKLAVQAFGGGKFNFNFDERTHIYRDGVETTQLGIRKGDRVYVDSMLDGTRLFARNIRVETSLQPADANGELLGYNARTGMLTLRDALSATPITFRVDQSTAIKSKDQPATAASLKPGSLIAVRFSPDRANRGVAREVSIIAVPGTAFTFRGRLTFLDLKDNLLAVENATDDKIYDIHFDRARVPITPDLRVGALVDVKATFEPTGYRADSVTVEQSAGSEAEGTKPK